jgi:hypothetical protein
MKLMNLITTALVFLLLCSTTQANMNNEVIQCPSIETIHQISPLFRNAWIYQSGPDYIYRAELSDIKSNGKYWSVISDGMIIKTDNREKEAASIAERRSAAVSHMVYPNARTGAPSEDKYACLYYDDTQPNKTVSIIAETRQ